MPIFHYEAIDIQGRKKSGLIDAENAKEAREKVRKQGLVLKSLSSKTGSSVKALPFKSLYAFTLQTAQLLKAGVPLYESLVSIAENSHGEEDEVIIQSLCQEIKKGSSLSQALSLYPASFSSLYIACIRAAEASGTLADAFLKLTKTLQKQEKEKNELKSALIYPTIVLSLSLFVIIVLMTFVVPSMEALFEGRNPKAITAFVFACSHVLIAFWPYLLLMIGLSAFSLAALWKKPHFQAKLHKLILKLPIVGKILQTAALSRFFRSFSALLEGGSPMTEALKVSQGVLAHPELEAAVEEARKEIILGKSLSESLKKGGAFTKMSIRMLKIGEESGRLAPMLFSLSELFEEDLERRIRKGLALLQPIVLIFLGLIIGIVVLAVLLPLTDVNSLISS